MKKSVGYRRSSMFWKKLQIGKDTNGDGFQVVFNALKKAIYGFIAADARLDVHIAHLAKKGQVVPL